MSEHILFLTGKLAEKSLHKVLRQMQPTDFSYDVRQMGVSVAALLTTDMIHRRLNRTDGADRIILPGRCRGDISALSSYLGIPVERGPEELKDLPAYFGKASSPVDLNNHAVQIFAEIVDAPNMGVSQIIEQANYYRNEGADVIDLGCLPDTPFPHLEESIMALKTSDFHVSIDSMDTEELLRGGRAGADYLLSLKEDTLWVTNEVHATPILIPTTPNDLNSLYRSIDILSKRGKYFVADSVLDPIHSGFTNSLLRYHALRQHFPDIEILMGIGNLTELTHADTAGINAILAGVMSELSITHLLTTQVSKHCRKAVREADLARRIMFAAHENNVPPQYIDDGLMALHERKPIPYSAGEIRALAKQIKDPSFRIQVSDEGIHIYDRNGIHTANDPFDLYPKLGVENDGGHAFYLGVELARAQIAWQLGKRYDQDDELKWGCAVERPKEDLSTFKEPGPTLQTRSTAKNRASRKK